MKHVIKIETLQGHELWLREHLETQKTAMEQCVQNQVFHEGK